MLAELLDIFFPPVCPLCEGSIAEGLFCEACAGGLSSQKILGPKCVVCGTPFVSASSPDHICGVCQTQKMPFISSRSALAYNGAVVDAVHSFKYCGKVILGRPLGRLLAGTINLPLAPQAVIPVPLHKKRLRERGFNQALLLAREVARHLGARVDYTNLKRLKNTAQQVQLKTEERRENVKGAFILERPGEVEGRTVLLIDDVYTTGATIMECAKVLKKAGASVHAITLARTVKA